MMDLGTVKKKLEKGKYHDVSEAADDIRLVWKNCMTYNADGSDFYRLADSYRKRFEERYQKLIDEFGEDVITGNVVTDGGGGTTRQQQPPSLMTSGKKSRSNSFTSTGRKTPIAASAEDNNNIGGSSSAAASKSDRNGGSSSLNYEALGIIPLDVRTRFAARLQRLSGMELGHVLQTIDMSCPEALEDPTDDQLRLDAPIMTKRHRYAWDEFDGGCQIEIDVDAIPAETFWKLDTYVKEKVQDRGRGPWSDDLTEVEQGGKKRKIKSF